MGDAQAVKRLLAGLSYPAIPEHLADRIGAALGAEAAIRANREATSRVVMSSHLISWPALARQAAKARAESRAIREDTARVVGLVGEIERVIAESMNRLASQNPKHAEHLVDLSQAARQGAKRAGALA